MFCLSKVWFTSKFFLPKVLYLSAFSSGSKTPCTKRIINLCDYSFSFWWEKPFLPNPASNSFPRLDTHPSRKVRNAVHKKIAELTTWSLKVAAEGVWPHKGFRDEEFAQRTSRYKKRGKVIANGFKILAETKVFPISMFSSQYFSYSRCPCILQLEPSSGYVFSLSKRI